MYYVKVFTHKNIYKKWNIQRLYNFYKRKIKPIYNIMKSNNDVYYTKKE